MVLKLSRENILNITINLTYEGVDNNRRAKMPQKNILFLAKLYNNTQKKYINTIIYLCLSCLLSRAGFFVG